MKNHTFTRLEIKDDLGLLDGIWRDWRLLDGELFDPMHSSFRGYRPEEIRTIPYLRQLIAALHNELRRLKSPEREPRQLPSLSRPAQATEPGAQHLGNLTWRASAPLSIRIGPDLVRANPARQKRSLP